MKIERMPYRSFKGHYADCEPVPGTYDKASKTIEVMIPAGREKPSGVRGKTYKYLEFHGTEKGTGRAVTCTIKAICLENAVKRLPKDCVWNI